MTSKKFALNGKQTVKKILKKYFICKYVNGKTLLGPQQRLVYLILESSIITALNLWVWIWQDQFITKLKTVYIKLTFYCLLGVTRASNIELTIDQSLHSVMLALRIFFTRRGKTKLVISDNFQTFKSTELKNFLQNNSIEWEFILQNSPWWGGFYEGMIGITKSCIEKVKGKALLTFEELQTVITEIENALNARPLTYVDEDPDSNIITLHYLIYGRNINEKCFETNQVPNISSTDTQNLAAHMKLVLEHYFKRSEKEYTLALQEQHFHVNRCYGNYKRELRGDIVLIKEDILPRMR